MSCLSPREDRTLNQAAERLRTAVVVSRTARTRNTPRCRHRTRAIASVRNVCSVRLRWIRLERILFPCGAERCPVQLRSRANITPGCGIHFDFLAGASACLGNGSRCKRCWGDCCCRERAEPEEVITAITSESAFCLLTFGAFHVQVFFAVFVACHDLAHLFVLLEGLLITGGLNNPAQTVQQFGGGNAGGGGGGTRPLTLTPKTE